MASRRCSFSRRLDRQGLRELWSSLPLSTAASASKRIYSFTGRQRHASPALLFRDTAAHPPARLVLGLRRDGSRCAGSPASAPRTAAYSLAHSPPISASPP